MLNNHLIDSNACHNIIWTAFYLWFWMQITIRLDIQNFIGNEYANQSLQLNRKTLDWQQFQWKPNLLWCTHILNAMPHQQASGGSFFTYHCLRFPNYFWHKTFRDHYQSKPFCWVTSMRIFAFLVTTKLDQQFFIKFWMIGITRSTERIFYLNYHECTKNQCSIIILFMSKFADFCNNFCKTSVDVFKI